MFIFCAAPTMKCDLFCSVVDNYGDIGITWRLARQMAAEHAISVRLWVDDLHTFRHIQPEIDPGLDIQTQADVEVRRWSEPFPEIIPGDVIIEALGCNLPESLINTMAKQSPPPVWLNLEYLSAENWVAGVHGLPSPHPRHSLVKHFFMPGFTAQTGGLTRESGLTLKRDTFQNDENARRLFWHQLGQPESGRMRASLFSYESACLPSLLGAIAQGKTECDLLVPFGRAVPGIAQWFDRDSLEAGSCVTRGQLRVFVLPMLPVDDYDRLLWACDLNFVRGEDSFVRAQFAGQPMVWQAYRQDDGAHLGKLEAFLDLYCAELPPEPAADLRAFWRAWNREENVSRLWQAYHSALPTLRNHARIWAAQLAQQDDLASNLVKFINKLLECRAF